MASRPFRDEAHRDAALLKWLRREVNRDLRYWRIKAGTGTLPSTRYLDLVADCKAKLGMIAWAEHWQSVRTPEHSPDDAAHDAVQASMLSHLSLVNGMMRRVAAGYRGRDGWRSEWEVRL